MSHLRVKVLIKSHILTECQLDLVVIIDVSGRQSSQRLDDVKRFLIGIVESVDVSPDGTHMGLIIFSDRATTKLTLNNPVGKQKLLQVCYKFAAFQFMS